MILGDETARAAFGAGILRLVGNDPASDGGVLGLPSIREFELLDYWLLTTDY